MKTLIASCLNFFVLTACLGQSAEDPAALISIETLLLEATAAHNGSFLGSLFDDQFHGVIASGHTVDKAKMLEYLETSSPYVFLSLEEIKAIQYGIVAITTGKLVSKSKSGSVIGQSRFTHIYLLKNNKWKMIESQHTVIIQN